MRLALLALLALALAPGALQAKSFSENDLSTREILEQAIEYLSAPQATSASRDQTLSCQAPSPIRSIYGYLPASLQINLSEWDCKDLFAERSPSWLIPAKSAWWWPVCTATHIEQRRLNHGSRYQEAWRKHYEVIIAKGDACEKTKGPRDRSDPRYRSLSQRQLQLKVMPVSDRIVLEKQIKSLLKDQVTPACCGSGDAECRNLMNQVDIRWCKPLEDPDASDPCTDNNTRYQLGDAGWDEFYKWSSKMAAIRRKSSSNWSFTSRFAQEAKTLPVRPGYITLPPFYDGSNQPQKQAWVVAHELSHACSFIRQRLEITRGNVEAWEAFGQRTGSTGSFCEISPAVTQSYSKALLWSGASEETASCLWQLANNARKSRYTEKNCPSGCPHAYLEESMANWLAAKSIDDSQWFSHVVVGFCNLDFRDTTHPLAYDEMGCFMKTPSFAQRMTRNIGCQK